MISKLGRPNSWLSIASVIIDSRVEILSSEEPYRMVDRRRENKGQIRVADVGMGVERREWRKVSRSDSRAEADLFWDERAQREAGEAVTQVAKKWVRASEEEVHSS
jgi:hypothetical protein